MPNQDRLTTNQRRALAAILANKTIRAAAQACGLAERTIWRYLADDLFLQAWRAEQNKLYTAAKNRLAAGLDQALAELESLMTTAESESVRRAAVADWLAHCWRLRELDELEARIAALEALA